MLRRRPTTDDGPPMVFPLVIIDGRQSSLAAVIVAFVRNIGKMNPTAPFYFADVDPVQLLNCLINYDQIKSCSDFPEYLVLLIEPHPIAS